MGGIWSPDQILQPGVPLSELSGFEGFRVSAVDASGRATTIADPAIFQVGFLSSGRFQGTLDENLACFVKGTSITTDHGEVPVEFLTAGDLVRTESGGLATIKWIGYRRLDCSQHRSQDVWPVQIHVDAFGPGLPHRLLWLSPDHAIYTDGVLIPIRLLINNGTIAQEPRKHIVYFHIELETHDVLLAEGLPAESYLDTGNRAAFENAGIPMVLHPDFSGSERIRSRERNTCAPLAVAPNEVEPIWQRLAARAATLGHPASLPAVTKNPQLRLSVAGRDIQPITATDDRFVFILPPHAQSARLISRAAAPSGLRPWLDDRRHLGVSVRRIVLDDGTRPTAIPPDHPSLTDGWHDVERDGERLWRWTDGDAQLPLPAGARMVEIHLAGSTEYPVGAPASVQILAA